MYIQIKTVDGKTRMVTDLSKTMQVADLKIRLESLLNIKTSRQRLFFRGKQMEDEYSLFDYNINMNDVVQAMEKPDFSDLDKESDIQPGSSTDQAQSCGSSIEEEHQIESLYYKIGDYIDMKDKVHGAWFEGKIMNIIQHEIIIPDSDPDSDCEKSGDSLSCPMDDGLIYKIQLFGESSLCDAKLDSIRPRARNVLPFSSLKVGDLVMVNYNIEVPSERGYWYDFRIKDIKVKGSKKELLGNVYIGKLSSPILNCKILFPDEVMKIEKVTHVSNRDESELLVEPPHRESGVSSELCAQCRMRPNRRCKQCGCHICGSKLHPDKQIMCDECDFAFHIWCVTPALDSVPTEDEWFCNACKNDENEIVKAGDKLKVSKKKAKMASSLNQTNRDWGKGMACVGRSKECTIVPSNHFGPIPGVEVGTQWKFRVQVSEAGVHRPHVAGIHGRESEGAYSIVLSGGYEDDVDNGDDFAYTGSGGRDLSGNKRTAIQSCDQTLTRMNKALAINCNAPLNTKKGAEATNWKGGKPVRVVRNYKLAKYSKYAPKEGNRYDGIYKLYKYYPEKGKSGFIVWRYLFRRDDPIPAPWSKEGKKRIESLGLEMTYPDGYVEAMRAKGGETTENDTAQTRKTTKSSKRVLGESPPKQKAAKKPKIEKYKINTKIEMAITKDRLNKKLWTACKEKLILGKPKFLAHVEEVFTCICCMDLVCNPVTLACYHNVCFECIKRSFSADIKTCPHCREPVKSYKKINENLKEALLNLFPGYTAGRK